MNKIYFVLVMSLFTVSQNSFAKPPKRNIASEGTVIVVEGKEYNCENFMKAYAKASALKHMTAEIKALKPWIACKIEKLSPQDEKVMEAAPSAFKECRTSEWVYDYQKNLVEGAEEMMKTLKDEFVDCRS